MRAIPLLTKNDAQGQPSLKCVVGEGQACALFLALPVCTHASSQTGGKSIVGGVMKASVMHVVWPFLPSESGPAVGRPLC